MILFSIVWFMPGYFTLIHILVSDLGKDVFQHNLQMEGATPAVIRFFIIMLSLLWPLWWLVMVPACHMIGRKESKPVLLKNEDPDYGSMFYVVDLGDVLHSATRSKSRVSGDTNAKPLTRRLLYNRLGWSEAEHVYAHQFMCCGFPRKPDPLRQSADEWLDDMPFEYEIDDFVTEMLWPGQYRRWFQTGNGEPKKEGDDDGNK